MNQLPVNKSTDKAIRTNIRLRFGAEAPGIDGSNAFLSILPHN
jgi:hypothetical protein